jgi:xanthine dehydrogenase YagR molybdenum-binding subunit
MKDRYWIEGPQPETPDPSAAPGDWDSTRVIGDRRARIDGYERVSGAAVYPSDVILPGMLFGAILRCPHAHAEVQSVDTSAAEKMPGVRAVITGSTPGCDLDWSYGRGVTTKLFDRHCRHEGEAVAAVAADTPHQARDALRSIRVDYRVLPFTVDEFDALAPGAPPVWPDGNRVSEPQTSERGDVDAGFAAADVVLEESYRCFCEVHNPIELHGCVASWDGDRVTIWESTQGVYAVERTVSRTLGVPLSKVRVIGHYVGGGFGSKLQAGKYTIVAALLARRAARPVKLFLSREECQLTAGNRPAAAMRLKAGVAKDGRLTALEFEATGVSGAYPAGGTSLLDWLIRDLYRCDNVRTVNHDVYVNAGPARPFRAPGHPQGAWALEQMMDALARAIELDPVELRLRNIPTVSQARGGAPYTTNGLEACLREGATAFGWDAARARDRSHGHLKRGVGAAACLWVAGGGGPPSTVIVKLFADGSANLNMGASDIGTGTKTVMAMVVAEVLGVPLEQIVVENADTGTTQYATPSGGSKTVPTESPAVRHAAESVAEQLRDMAAAQLGIEADDVVLADGGLRSRSDPTDSVKLADLEGLQRRGVVTGIGYRGPNPDNRVVNPFAAQFCEVEVNTRTGEIRLLRFLGAHDSGRVLNRLTYDNQVFGGIAMGIGFAMTERRILDRARTGKMCNLSLHDYKMPTIMDVPQDMISVPIDRADLEANATGVKGLGEPVTIPTAAAIANAVFDATGVRPTDTFLNPTQLIELLGAAPREA